MSVQMGDHAIAETAVLVRVASLLSGWYPAAARVVIADAVEYE